MHTIYIYIYMYIYVYTHAQGPPLMAHDCMTSVLSLHALEGDHPLWLRTLHNICSTPYGSWLQDICILSLRTLDRDHPWWLRTLNIMCFIRTGLYVILKKKQHPKLWCRFSGTATAIENEFGNFPKLVKGFKTCPKTMSKNGWAETTLRSINPTSPSP